MKTNQFPLMLAAFAALLLFAVGCKTTPKESAATVDNATLKKEIEAANVEFAGFIAKGDSMGMANFYTEDAKLMVPNEPAIVGRKNIQTAVHNVLSWKKEAGKWKPFRDLFNSDLPVPSIK